MGSIFSAKPVSMLRTAPSQGRGPLTVCVGADGVPTGSAESGLGLTSMLVGGALIVGAVYYYNKSQCKSQLTSAEYLAKLAELDREDDARALAKAQALNDRIRSITYGDGPDTEVDSAFYGSNQSGEHQIVGYMDPEYADYLRRRKALRDE